jgi:TPR repeat protein
MESKSSTIYGVFSMLSMHPRIVEALEKIAEKGNVHAAWYLANAYSWGDMGIRDSVKARKWLQLTASLGLDYQVAVEAVKIVLDGSHAVPHEEMFRPEELFSWSTSGTWWWSEFWVDAEGKAMAESYFRYAEKLCNEGPGRTLRDEAWAAWWYQAAAMQGHPEAKQRLVHMQFPPTWAIMNMFRPVDQQPSSPKTP